ncbi:MAG: membrane protein insertase YidC [Candidatus Brennerbacteria bacterium]|nr:membrane protein insertase YidC [Candidatus Brennerbacteria bacterium]
MGNLFQTYLYHPILAALVWIYQTISFQDLGIAIVLLTVVVRVALLPLFWKSAKDQTILQAIQPKVKEIQERHKEDREAQGRALMALYREHRVNPLSGILFLALQIPVFIALFQIFTRELGNGVFDSRSFLGLVSLEERNFMVAVLAAGLQYLQARLMPQAGKTNTSDKTDRFDSAKMTKIFGLVIGPAITLIVLTPLPSALGIYWIASTVFSIAQQIMINRAVKDKILPAAILPHSPSTHGSHQ